jgi:hypothetical protein
VGACDAGWVFNGLCPLNALSLARHSARALRAGAQLVLHRLPGDSRCFGAPRRGVVSSHEWWEEQGEKYGASRQTIFSATEARLRDPLHFEPELPTRFAIQQNYSLPETFVLTLPGGRVSGRHGAIITPDDAVLGDVSLEVDQAVTGDPWKPQLLTQVKLPPLGRSEETVAVVSSLWGEGFFHWFYDALPRLELLRRSGIKIDKYVVNAEFEFQRESMRLLGIPPEKWIVAEPRMHLEARQLVAPSLPGPMGTLPHWSSEFLRSQILPQVQAGQKRRIYISRQKAKRRKLANPEEIEPLLQSFGFETVFLEEMSLTQQAALFAGAAAVVAPHGAGLSNLVFCPPETPVIELFSPHYLVPCYWNLASDNDLRYGFVLGEKTGSSSVLAEHPDTRINPDKLERALQSWIGAAR